MTEDELRNILSVRFEEGSADRWADLLLEHESIGAAMELALGRKTVVPFRASYALERAFLKAPERFEPFYERFKADFPVVAHTSVWRHYGKIMALLLKRKKILPTDAQAERIAEAAVLRLVDEQVPVGARVWSLDILYYLRGRVEWIDRDLPEIIDDLRVAPTPAMISRLRRYGWLKR
jgi:hypothetical protein